MDERQPTVAEAVHAYLRDLTLEGRASTAATYKSHLRRLRLCSCPVADLHASLRDRLAAACARLTPNGARAVSSAHHALAVYCLTRGWLLTDPLLGLRLPRQREPVHEYRTAAELQRLLACATDPRDRAGLLLVGMGLRAKEACSLRPQDIQHDDEGPVLRFRAVKGGSVRELPLDQRTYDAVRALTPRKGTVLGFGPHQLWVRLTALGERAGVPFRPHLGRHAWAMAWTEQTGDIDTLQTLGGWVSGRMPRYYARSALRRTALKKARAVNLSGRLFGE